VIVYVDPKNAPLLNIPERLRGKALQQFAEAAESYGLRPANSAGLPQDAFRLDTRNVASSQHLYEWLSSVQGLTVVDLEPSDLACAFDHKMSPEALDALRHFPTEHLSQLEPSDIPDALRGLMFVNNSPNHEAILDDSDLGKALEADIVNDLRKAGLSVPAGDRLEQWEAAQKVKPRETSREFSESARSPFEMSDDMGLL
jgi:hypothetical protein